MDSKLLPLMPVKGTSKVRSWDGAEYTRKCFGLWISTEEDADGSMFQAAMFWGSYAAETVRFMFGAASVPRFDRSPNPNFVLLKNRFAEWATETMAALGLEDTMKAIAKSTRDQMIKADPSRRAVFDQYEKLLSGRSAVAKSRTERRP